MHFLLTRSCCVPWTAAEETYPVLAELVAFILSLWGGMNYCVILWLMTTNDLWFLFGISLGELSAVSRGHSSSAVPWLSTILAHPPFLDVDLGWWCALFTQQWREKPYFLLKPCFLPSLLQVRCVQRKGSRWWSSSISAKACSGLQSSWSNSLLVMVGRGPHVGAHMHVIFEECAVMWVWRERAGPLSLPVGAAEGNMCSVSGSSSVWVLKTKLNRNQLL